MVSTVLVLGLFSVTGGRKASADEIYTFVIKKQEEKKSTRWSLSEWLKTRDKMRLMDLWLALHSPSPYEFFLDGGIQWGDRNAGGRYTNWRGQVGAYASIFGIQAEREFAPINQSLALFDLRIFGYHAQGTNITLQGGLRAKSGASSFRSGAAGVATTIDITKFFGLDGRWLHFFGAAPSGAYVGNRFEAGAFVDFSFLRVYGLYFKQSDFDLSGAMGGLRLYF